MKKLVLVTLCLLFAAIFAAPAFASPALPITKPPLGPVPSNTGPAIDPDAIAGQWFWDLETQTESVRPYEFHDNKYECGGSLVKSTLAIEGYVQNVVYDGQGNITGFGIKATITNDTPQIYGQWQEGDNLHGEEPYYSRQPYIGDMYQTKLTVEFADDGVQGNLPTGAAYLPEQNIYAMNYDELGWYCWTDVGGYIVPTYDFGDIPVWLSATRNLNFGLYLPEAPDSSLAIFLEEAEMNQWDVFMNRTTSLKTSQYVDNLLHDDGSPYPAPPRSSDVSVFFVPEPTTMALLVLGGLLLRGLKRR
jgi:hypothetical protein